jgi:hypothetical protein
MLSTVLIVIVIVCLFAAGLKVSWQPVEFMPLGFAFIALGVLLPL